MAKKHTLDEFDEFIKSNVVTEVVDINYYESDRTLRSDAHTGKVYRVKEQDASADYTRYGMATTHPKTGEKVLIKFFSRKKDLDGATLKDAVFEVSISEKGKKFLWYR